mgnify:FL=1
MNFVLQIGYPLRVYYTICNTKSREITRKVIKIGGIMFIEKLEMLVKENNLTMNRLAKNAGFSQANTDRWKKGSMPNTDALIKICKYLNVSADYLLDLDETPPPILTDQEQKLLEHFRQCSPGEQQSILLLANAGANKAEQEKESLNSKIVG